MHLMSELLEVTWWAVALAAILPFMLGAVWYGPLFGRAWMSASGMTEEKVQSGKMGRIFGLAFLLQAIQAMALAVFIGPGAGAHPGALVGFGAALALVATATGIFYLFEQRPLGHFAVNAGYAVVSLTVMGTILGAWG